MTSVLLAVRAIDVAIFGSMFGLWCFGAWFIAVVWRWVFRFEATSGDSFAPSGDVEPTAVTARVASASALPLRSVG